MSNAYIKGTGFYVPEKVVTNADLERHMDTSDEWIQERTGIRERRYCTRHEEATSTLATHASQRALERAGMNAEEIDLIIFATLSPDYYFPGCGVLLQRQLGINGREIPALDIRNQCSGFVYGLSVADAFIKSGTYKNILLVGAETHSMGLDYSTEGRNVTVIFGDGAGAVILGATDESNHGILVTRLHANGEFAEELAMINPGSHSGVHVEDPSVFGYEPAEFGESFVSPKMLTDGLLYPNMNGQLVFKNAVAKFPEVINEALTAVGLNSTDINLLICHQANLRISQFVQKLMGLRDDQVWNNIQRYGNTTAASIPIALSEAYEAGKIKKGDLVCLAAFGSGFTWGASLIRW
ncbi:MAG TPA: beta-ketoacyl-ACP synthase III [Saprospiraceae bacterium]|nr:beta-ketoacyl-ACP synthase III [Saprospiraceae bacterium]